MLSQENIISDIEPIVSNKQEQTYIGHCQTRTHSMARHRKTPRSQRNLMVIDPLTPSQGHQFDHRLNFFSVSWYTALPL